MRERRPGVWELIVQLPRDVGHGRAKQLSRSLAGTKREAQRGMAALVAEVDAGKIISSSTSMSELFDRWLEHVEGQPSPTTAREYRRLVAKMLGPALGHLPLRKITTHRIDEFYAELSREKRLSPGTIRHAHAVVRGALGQAHKWGWIPSNPAVAVSLPRARRKEITPPAITDMRALLAEADARDPGLRRAPPRADSHRRTTR